ncbi:transcription factor IIA alpha-beta subunit [Trypanosoma rangeli]|uniref:Transcription factor IIA alpha-beta subunit n=1 Tax=Trypanosoma rangeli TaxID=5698 RepID=A0A3R7KEG5_TRYRA|nr:transcription factor IIA alpha-beta subunit [Trypanosoma rangeli]RNF04865.1 transcription factor IIA alpha-beta subunit [Trypanosoma rangeli]|eukprot:RNF04865.1 transcription factor IIA alpha-beta subunit [Trypanosoma rangeli]
MWEAEHDNVGKKKYRRRQKRPLCSTSDVYESAMRNFRQLLLERMSHHEDEVFSARARFQMQRAHDKEHFDRIHRKRKNSDRVRGTAVRHSLRHAIVSAEDVEEPSVAEQEFLADQEKLYLEHEEELQRSYPLAFLDDETAGAVAFTLMPMLRGKFEALAQERTRHHKECREITEPKRLSSVSNPAVQLPHGSVKDSAVDRSQTVFVKEEHDPDVSATLEVGRGAYIIPQTVTQQIPKINDVGENDREVSLSSEANSADGNDSCDSVDSGRAVVTPSWLSTITSRGEVEFVRTALLSKEQSRLARREEKRRWLEGLLTPATPPDMQQRAQEELRRLEVERKDEARKSAELWCLWRAVRDRINSSSCRANNMDDRESAAASGNQDDAERTGRERSSAFSVEEAESDKAVDDKDRDGYYTPTGLGSERWRKRMELVATLDDKYDINKSTDVSSAVTHFVSSCPNASSSFGMSWETITIDELTNTDGSDSNVSNRLEVKAQSYLWPHHIETSIPHVLCGEAVRGGGWWRAFLPDAQGTVTHGRQPEEAEDDAGASGDGQKSGRRTEGELNAISVVKFPRCARKVWLKLDSLGDFVAETVRFYQARLHI